ADVADLDVLHHADHPVADVLPARLRHIHAAGRRALLSLEFVRAADGRDRDFLRIGRRGDADEVLAAGFADESRITAVLAEVLPDLLPHAVEDAGAAGEMNAGKIRVVE